jgi:hypothetical protein
MHVRLRSVVVPPAFHLALVDDFVELGNLRVGQGHLGRTQVLKRPRSLGRARERNDVRAEVGNPRDRQLRGRHTLLLCERRGRADDREIVVEVLRQALSESRENAGARKADLRLEASQVAAHVALCTKR